MCSFHTYLWSNYYVPSTVPGTVPDYSDESKVFALKEFKFNKVNIKNSFIQQLINTYSVLRKH